MIVGLFAHAEELHTSGGFGLLHQLTQPLTLWLTLALVPFVILFICLTLLKMKLATTLLIICVFLIIFGAFSYQAPGAYTALALSLGFGIILATTLFSLGHEA